MKIIIVGAGKIGATLIRTFIKEGHNVVLIDSSEVAVTDNVNRYDINGFIGGGTEKSVLIEAGVKEADFLIACTSKDEVNILSCVLAKKLGAKHTIARVRDPRYFNEIENIGEDLGLDLAFNPELQTAIEIERVVRFPSAKSVESFAGGKASMVEFDIVKGNPIIHKSIMEICREYGNEVLFAMVKRGDKVIIPRGELVVLENDVIYIIGDEEDIINFTKSLKIFKPKAKSAFIVGGGKICYYLASALIKSGVDVKILESNKERCEELSYNLSSATILCADGTDHAILEEEGIKASDVCVTLTGMDEENVIISLFAKTKNVAKIVTKVDRLSVASMVKQFGLDTIISPKSVIANQIVRFVRESQSKEGEGLNNLYLLADGVEALEFTVKSSFEKLGVPLKELKIKKNILVAGVVREGEFILPTGDTCFNALDRVIIVSGEKQINEFKDILE